MIDYVIKLRLLNFTCIGLHYYKKSCILILPRSLHRLDIEENSIIKQPLLRRAAYCLPHDPPPPPQLFVFKIATNL